VRFYQHHGFDWHEIEIAADDDLEDGHTCGASTITQQLVKNLFFGTDRSVLRKCAEFTLVPVAEFVLGKRRHSGDLISTSLNGALVFMVQSRHVVTTTVPRLGVIGREQAVRVAAILPSPVKRRPERMSSSRSRN
jgi:monofunctional biosynthetic peptidoglycan transglycosylase